MNVAALALMVTAAIAAVALVLLPIMRAGRSAPRQLDPDPSWKDRDTELDLALEELEGIDREYAAGALEAEDYAHQRAQLRGRALQVLQDREARMASLDRAIEARLSSPDGGAAPVPRSQLPPDKVSLAPRRVRLWLIAGGTLLAAGFVFGLVWLVVLERGGASQLAAAELALPDYSAIAAWGGTPQGLLVGFSGGLMATQDGGQTWRKVGPQAPIKAVASNATGIFAAGTGLFAAEAVDGEWRSIGPVREFLAIAAGAEDPLQIVALEAGGALWLSVDGGGSWQRLPAQAPPSTSAIAMMSGPRLYFLSTLDQGVLGGDGQGDWFNASGFVNGALPTVRVPSIFYDPFSGDSFEGVNGRFEGALYAGTDLGLFRSVDGGLSWNRLPLEASVAAVTVSTVEPRIITVLDTRGRVFRSGDRGLSWSYGAR